MPRTTNERTLMKTTTEFQDRFEFPEPPDRVLPASREQAVVFDRRAPAANDADGASSDAAIEAIVRTKPGAHELHRAALAWRSYTLGEILAAMATATADLVREMRARSARRREARTVRAALAELDDRALRDLGLDRSEIGSVAAEVTGAAERTRRLAVLTWSGFPQ